MLDFYILILHKKYKIVVINKTMYKVIFVFVYITIYV